MNIEKFENYDLKQHTTFKIGGCAKNVYLPKDIDELAFLLYQNPDSIVLGGCSNIILSSKGVEEDVILTTKLNKYKFTENTLTAECGTKGPLLSKEAQKLGLSGFEFMIGFPGTVGGMLHMNASAHNQSISDSFICATVFDYEEKKIKSLTKEDMKFDYRTSILAKKPYILLESTFELKQMESQKINELMDRNLEFRRLRQPSLALPNIGSIFKNPENDSAGRLLDLAGAKKIIVGGAKVWDGHANFIVNDGTATSDDVLNLMHKMYDIVKQKYTIELKPEVKFIGKRNEKEEKLWQKLNGKNIAKIQK